MFEGVWVCGVGYVCVCVRVCVNQCIYGYNLLKMPDRVSKMFCVYERVYGGM
jgi:hypothetical protein